MADTTDMQKLQRLQGAKSDNTESSGQSGSTASTGNNQKSAPVTLKQGSSYNPKNDNAPKSGREALRSASGNQQNQNQDEGENNDNGNGNKSGGLNKGSLIIIGVIALIVLVVVFVIVFNKRSGDPTSGVLEGDSSEAEGTDMEYNPEDDPYAYDPNNDPYADPTVTADPSMQGSTGTPSDTGVTGDIGVTGDTGFAYTSDELNQLRAMGYTGTEIEEFQSYGYDFEYLAELAEDAREAYIEEKVKPLFDTASEEYKQNYYNTWLGMPLREDMDLFRDDVGNMQETRNLDYEKVPVHGYQVFLKVYLDDREHAEYFFMQVSPERYVQLNDSGNIVVTYTYMYGVTEDADGNIFTDESRMFIIDAYEEGV